MKLFERVDEIAKKLAGSQTKLATILGLRQKQFNGYLNTVSERNLWEHLPVILEVFPQVSRYWLYFGEGEMLDSSYTPPLKESPEKTEIARLHAELDEERKLNRKLTLRLLGEDNAK